MPPNSASQFFTHFGAREPAKGRPKDTATKKHPDSLLPKIVISTSLILALAVAIMAANHVTLAKLPGLLDGTRVWLSESLTSSPTSPSGDVFFPEI